MLVRFLEDRVVSFSVQLLRFVDTLPRGLKRSWMSDQLARSGTGVGSNYEEALGAESPADFAHKLGVALKECREAYYWLRVLQGWKAEELSPDKLVPLMREALELRAILGKSVLTAKSRLRTDRLANNP